MAKITYDNKVALNEEPSVAAINKVSDDDMNEIKSSVNDLYDTVGTNTSNISSLTTTTNNLVARTTDTIIFRSFDLEESITLTAYASVYKGTTISAISGYTPILCYEVLGIGDASVRGYTSYPNSNLQVGCWIKNFGNTSTTISGVNFKVIYIKNPL